MALIVQDRVKVNTTTTGTGTVVLGATAPTGYQSFAVIGNNNTTYYTIAGQTTNEWEVGIGTYFLANSSLSRTTILSSSAANAAVSFSAGTKDVFVTYPAETSVYSDGTVLTAPAGALLPIASGGTNAATAPAALTNLRGWSTTATAAGTTTLTNTSTTQQEFTGATTQTVVLPVTSTLALGWAFEIINQSTGSLTINSSGGNLVGTVTAGTTASIVCVLTSGTDAASWDFDIDGFSAQTGTGSVVRATSPTFATSVVGGATFSAFNTATTTLSMGGAATTFNLGGSTGNVTTNIATGATLATNFKNINIATGGVTGAKANVIIGQANTTVNTTVFGNLILSNATNAGQITFPDATVQTTAAAGLPAAGNSSIAIFNTNITANATIADGTNGLSVGPVNTANGVVVTIGANATWVTL